MATCVLSIFDHTGTELFTSVTERDITNMSAVISYTTYSGCSDFPSNLTVKLNYSKCNETTTNMIMTNIYTTDKIDETFNLFSLIPKCFYQYVLQVYDGDEPLGTSVPGMFTTPKNDLNDVPDPDPDPDPSGMSKFVIN